MRSDERRFGVAERRIGVELASNWCRAGALVPGGSCRFCLFSLVGFAFVLSPYFLPLRHLSLEWRWRFSFDVWGFHDLWRAPVLSWRCDGRCVRSVSCVFLFVG